MGERRVILFAAICFAEAFGLQAQNDACGAAMALHQQGNISAALSEYEACLRAEPGNVQARSNWGAALAHEGLYSRAIEQDRLALGDAPSGMVGALRLNLALAYYKGGRIPEAASEFRAILKEREGDRRVTILLAESELMLGKPEQAIALLKPLEMTASEDLTVAYLLGSALIRTGDLEQGQRLLDRILRNGESAEGHMLLGVTMFQAGNYPGAVKELALAQKLRPDLPSLQSYYGQALLNTGDSAAASEAFERELRLNATDFDSNLRLGEIRIARKQFDEALPLVERAAQIRPDSAEVKSALVAVRERRRQDRTNTEDGPEIGTNAPPFALQILNQRKQVSLTELLQKGPVLLAFGSYTCPQLRGAAPVLNELYAKFGNKMTFALVYVSEAHGTGTWQSTVNERERIDLPAERTIAEKQEHAALCVRKLRIPYQALVDGLDRGTEKAYAAWPSRVYLVDRQGRVKFKTRLTELEFDRDQLAAAVAGALGK